MASGFTDTWANSVLEHSVGKTDIGALPTVYVALTTTAPTRTAAGTEAAYTGYARVATAASDWESAATAAIQNAATITFGACTAGSSTVVGFDLYTASSGGTRIAFGACSLSVSTGITPRFSAGAFDITLSPTS